MVASFGLRNRDIHDFSACVMSDADVFHQFPCIAHFTVCQLRHAKFVFLDCIITVTFLTFY